MLGLPGGKRGAARRGPKSPQGDEMVQDPVCKVYVPLSRAVERKISGETHFFCSEECARKYIKNLP